jgi:hypothetical protein
MGRVLCAEGTEDKLRALRLLMGCIKEMMSIATGHRLRQALFCQAPHTAPATRFRGFSSGRYSSGRAVVVVSRSVVPRSAAVTSASIASSR